MKKIDLGQTIGILANIGVIAGIVFLGIELHQNNELLEAEVRYNHKETRVDYSKYISSNPDLVDALIRSRNGEILTDHDLFQLDRLRDITFTSWAWDYTESTNSDLEIPVEAYKAVLAKDYFLIEQWSVSKTYYPADFVQFIDELISEIDS